MPETIDVVVALAAVYASAQESIIDKIATRAAVGSAFVYQLAVLRDVQAELAELDRYAKDWTNKNVPSFYAEGWDDAFKVLKDAGVSAAKPEMSSTPLQILVENAQANLFEAHKYVGRAVADQVRQAGLQAAAKGFLGVEDVKRELINNLTERGITAIRDKRGREFKLDSYAEMVARTTAREASNQATIDQVQKLGLDLVKMSSHATACAVCIPLENRVYSISGNDKRFPPLSVAFQPPYANIHPNCAHVVAPYVEALDNNLEQTIAESNRPFELDEQMQKRVDAYKRQQAERAKRRRDYLQWERYKTTLPNETHKTFNGFRRSKMSNSERWQELERHYRDARRENAQPDNSVQVTGTSGNISA